MLPAFFHQTPFFRLLLPFIAGIMVGFRIEVPTVWNIVACAVLFTVLCITLWKWRKLTARNKTVIYGSGVYVFLFMTGIGAVSLRSFTPNDQSEQGVWVAVVEEPPVERENSMKATLRVQANYTSEQPVACDELIMAYFRKDDSSRNICQGDLLLINAALNPITNAGNPYEFDYRGYLNRKLIGRSAFIESGKWQHLDSYAQSPLLNLSNRLRTTLLGVFKRSGLNGNELAVVEALVLGYKADLDDVLREAYSSSGAMHVLAVSGLHVGIIFLILGLATDLIPFLNRVKWLRALILLVALWLYAMITGMSPSVMRAAAMFSFIAAGSAFRRKTYIYNSITASAFVLLLVNPANLFEVGFQLSYMAVIAIVFFHPYLYGLLSFKHRLADYAWNLTCVSLAAQIGTAPLALYYFHQFPIYFILSNFIVIPGASVIIYGSLLLFIVSPVAALMELAGWLLDKFLYGFNACIFFIEKLPGSVIWGIRFHGWEILLSYVLIAVISIWMLTTRKIYLFAVITLCLVWITGVTVSDSNDLQRRQLIVYHTQGNSLIQFIDGRTNIIWYAGRKPSFNAASFTNNQRVAMQLEEARCTTLGQALLHPELHTFPASLYVDGNFVKFAGKRMVLFTRELPPPDAGQQTIKTDVAILAGNINVGISQIMKTYRPDMIVVDASSSIARIDRWEKECKDEGVKFHRVDRHGAFMMFP